MGILKSKQGSTSILVLIFMIILMIFGLSILTTAISNTRLAEKKREWLTDYYELEEQVAYELADIDKIINNIKIDSQHIYKSKHSSMSVLRSKLYYDELIDQLTELGFELDGFESETENYVLLSFDLKEEQGSVPKHIAVELKIILPEDTVDEERFLELTNYEIKSHTEWQEPFEYLDSIKFEDPFENPDSR